MWARLPGRDLSHSGLHTQHGLSVLSLSCPLCGSRDPGDPARCLVSLGLCSSWSSGCLLCSADGSCLSVSPAKPKGLLLARSLEPDSWGQRSSSEASWHPCAMAAGKGKPFWVSRPWETQPCRRLLSVSQVDARGLWAECPSRNITDLGAPRQPSPERSNGPVRLLVSLPFQELSREPHRTRGLHLAELCWASHAGWV